MLVMELGRKVYVAHLAFAPDGTLLEGPATRGLTPSDTVVGDQAPQRG